MSEQADEGTDGAAPPPKPPRRKASSSSSGAGAPRTTPATGSTPATPRGTARRKPPAAPSPPAARRGGTGALAANAGTAAPASPSGPRVPGPPPPRPVPMAVVPAEDEAFAPVTVAEPPVLALAEPPDDGPGADEAADEAADETPAAPEDPAAATVAAVPLAHVDGDVEGDGAAAPARPNGALEAAAAVGAVISAGAHRAAAVLSNRGSRARRRELALAPVRLGTLSPRQLDRRAEVLNLRRIGKLEPGFKTWRRLWSLVVLIVIVAVIAVAVAAVLDLIVTAIGVAANHAISKSAGS